MKAFKDVLIASSLCMLFAAPRLAAETYYVSQSGSDSNSGTSHTQPFRSVKRAMERLSSGDSVYFRAGDQWDLTSPARITSSGSSSNPIVVGAYQVSGGNVDLRVSSNRPVFNGNLMVPTRANYEGLIHVTGRHVTVRDIVLKDSGGIGLRFHETDNGKVDNVKTDGSYFFGIQAFKSDKVDIKDCEVTRFGLGGRNYGEPVFPNGVSVRSSSNVRVRGCLVREGWGEGINSFYGSRNVVIEDNIVFAVRNIGIYVDSSDNVDVRNNLVLGTSNSAYHRYGNNSWVGPGIAFNNENYQFTNGGGSLTTSDFAKNVRVYNNLVAGTKIGVAFFGQHDSTVWRNFYVVHNTFVDNEAQFSAGPKPFNNAVIANNIFLSLSGNTRDVGDDTSDRNILWQSNYWSEGRPSFAMAGNDDVYDGLTVAKNNGWQSIDRYSEIGWADFKPTDSSSTVGAGSNITDISVTTDFNGAPHNAPRDLGALASGSGGPRSASRPKSPTQVALDF